MTTPRPHASTPEAVRRDLQRLRLKLDTLERQMAELEASGGGSGVSDHGALTGLVDDDHPQYLREDGTRALSGNLSAGGHKITNLAASGNAGDAVRHEDARLSDDRTASGLRSASTVVDVSAATAPSSGQILMATGGSAATWQNQFTSSGIWFTDAPSGTPSSYDDEFDGAALGGAWSELDNSSVLTVSVADGHVKFTNATNATTHVRGIYCTAPSESEWSIWCKLGQVYAGANCFTGLFVAQDLATNPTTADLWICGVGNNGTRVAFTQAATAYNAFGAGSSFGSHQSGYARIGYDGTNFTGWHSLDGISWDRIASVAKTLTPFHVGLFCVNTTGATTYHFFDFFRVVTGAGSSGPSAGLFKGRRL